MSGDDPKGANPRASRGRTGPGARRSGKFPNAAGNGHDEDYDPFPDQDDDHGHPYQGASDYEFDDGLPGNHPDAPQQTPRAPREPTVFDSEIISDDGAEDEGKPQHPPRSNRTDWDMRGQDPDDDERGSIPIGSIIQQNYEIRRFIARGGMGEVYEATNVHLDERLAIKVILPQWASKREVVDQFRMEAGTLSKLQHDALVQYRNFIYEAQLDVYCLVTEFIDGDNLADVLARVRPSPKELRALLVRLASGLQVAHGHGAIHRDMSPDNIILKDGRVDRAKIIDFGIAKDLNAGNKAIFADGFSGKLTYAAPEQLGLFGAQMGEWSDVYSLALVIKAVARGEELRLGTIPADAVKSRQNGIELGDVPEDLRPVLEAMLKPDPSERVQTMGQVLSMLERGKQDVGLGPAIKKSQEPGKEPGIKRSPLLLGAGAFASLLALGALGYVGVSLLGDGGAKGGGQVPQGASAKAAPSDVVAAARRTFQAAAPKIDCSWLREVSITEDGGQVSFTLSGVAPDPTQVQRQLTEELQFSGLAGSNINLRDVATISRAGCDILNAFRERQTVAGGRLEAQQRRYKLSPAPDQPSTKYFVGQPAAQTVVKLLDLASVEDYALLSIVPNGEVQMVISSREDKEREWASLFTPTEGGERFNPWIYNELGWTGVILVTGKGPFDPAILAPPIGQRDPEWRRKFREAAAKQNWQIEMEWMETVDQTPD